MIYKKNYITDFWHHKPYRYKLWDFKTWFIRVINHSYSFFLAVSQKYIPVGQRCLFFFSPFLLNCSKWENFSCIFQACHCRRIRRTWGNCAYLFRKWSGSEQMLEWVGETKSWHHRVSLRCVFSTGKRETNRDRVPIVQQEAGHTCMCLVNIVENKDYIYCSNWWIQFSIYLMPPIKLKTSNFLSFL